MTPRTSSLMHRSVFALVNHPMAQARAFQGKTMRSSKSRLVNSGPVGVVGRLEERLARLAGSRGQAWLVWWGSTATTFLGISLILKQRGNASIGPELVEVALSRGWFRRLFSEPVRSSLARASLGSRRSTMGLARVWTKRRFLRRSRAQRCAYRAVELGADFTSCSADARS
jgi:hypothetical protein